jgi:hypothetical protein
VPSPSEIKAAYERLQAAIVECSRLNDAEGILTDWVVVAAFQRFDGDDHRTAIMRLLPLDDTPYHRVMGLLDYAATLYRHELTEAE